MICSHNEWSPLKEVILGSSIGFEFPSDDEVFSKAAGELDLKSFPIDNKVIEETEEGLSRFESILTQFDVNVHRINGSYCPRDVCLIIGEKIIMSPTVWPYRRKEWDLIDEVVSCVSPYQKVYIPEDKRVMFDAANVVRCNYDIIYLVGYAGNLRGAKWLKELLGHEYNIHLVHADTYAGMHLDTTIIPLREGLVMLNAERVTDDTVPTFMKSWDKIWVHPNDLFDFQEGNYGSRSMYMNLFSINEHVCLIDPDQTFIRAELEKHHIMTKEVKLPHVKKLGGGHHCTTLDLLRTS
jgi:scyllo-inosamine-4-phosphate amidinotransferase 1